LSPIKAAAQERIVRQNTELAEFVSKLNEEKKELRNALANLEEQISQYRQRERTNEQVLSNPASRAPHYYGQFALSLGEKSPYIFFKFNPVNTDTFYDPLIVCINGILL